MPLRVELVPRARALVLHRESTSSSRPSVLCDSEGPRVSPRRARPRARSLPGYAKAARRGKNWARSRRPRKMPELTGSPGVPRLTTLQGCVSKTVDLVHHIIGDVDVVCDQPCARAGQVTRAGWRGDQLADLAHGSLRVREVVDQLVAPLLVLQVATAGGVDVHRRHAQARGLARGRGALADDERCKSQHIVEL